MADRNELIVDYFNKGYAYKEILAALYGVHNIKMSLRQLKRILNQMGMYRRKCDLSFKEICDVMQYEINKSGSLLGYRTMHQKLKVSYHIQISRETVRELQASLDPDGVETRKSRRLKRRQYVCKGPNDTWHLDGYDKLKRFGFAIHGCIDGYSRRILWLECASTNNCPKAVAGYYVDYVEQIGGTARLVRGDRGNENLNVHAIQVFFRRNGQDSLSGRNSYRPGRSTANQRIEAFWSMLKRTLITWWINYFKDMDSDGSWDSTDPMQKHCLTFCLNPVIQKELDDLSNIHNTHRIRPSPNQECPSGRPELIYTVPQCYGGQDYKKDVAVRDLALAKSFASRKAIFNCSEEFEQLALTLMAQHNLKFPDDSASARSLYDNLLLLINTI